MVYFRIYLAGNTAQSAKPYHLQLTFLNFRLNELKCGDSVYNLSLLIIIPIYLTHTSSSEGNLNESSLFSSLICCILTLGWVVPGLAHFLVVHTSTPLTVFINYYLRGEPYKTTVLLISPFKGTRFLFFRVLQKETRTRSIKNLSNLHVLWTSMLLVATITDGQAILLVRPPTVPHSMFTFVVYLLKYVLC